MSLFRPDKIIHEFLKNLHVNRSWVFCTFCLTFPRLISGEWAGVSPEPTRGRPNERFHMYVSEEKNFAFGYISRAFFLNLGAQPCSAGNRLLGSPAMPTHTHILTYPSLHVCRWRRPNFLNRLLFSERQFETLFSVLKLDSYEKKCWKDKVGVKRTLKEGVAIDARKKCVCEKTV